MAFKRLVSPSFNVVKQMQQTFHTVCTETAASLDVIDSSIISFVCAQTNAHLVSAGGHAHSIGEEVGSKLGQQDVGEM